MGEHRTYTPLRSINLVAEDKKTLVGQLLIFKEFGQLFATFAERGDDGVWHENDLPAIFADDHAGVEQLRAYLLQESITLMVPEMPEKPRPKRRPRMFTADQTPPPGQLG